jgi:acyl-coenzyme A thioesterase 9
LQLVRFAASGCPSSAERLLHATGAQHAEPPSLATGMPLSGSHTSITTQLWRLRSAKRAAEEASVASASEPLEPQLLLLTKPPHTTSIRYPFASDPVLREEYCNPWGKVRLGKLLEDLDSLAGTIAFDHWCDGPRTQCNRLG